MIRTVKVVTTRATWLVAYNPSHSNFYVDGIWLEGVPINLMEYLNQSFIDQLSKNLIMMED